MTPELEKPSHVTRQLIERLQAFVAYWRSYNASERSGAQSFLYRLLDVYEVTSHPGTIFEQHPVLSKMKSGEDQGSLFAGNGAIAFSQERMDMYLPKICVWEMKGPEEKDLQKHHAQILRYWSVTRTRYMVLCNFHEFWIYDTDRENGQLIPALKFTLAELPQHAEALLFLRGEEAYFTQRAEKVTTEIASLVGGLVRNLIESSPEQDRDRYRVTKFVLECVFAMFAEDAGLMPRLMFTSAIEHAFTTGRMDAVYSLFDDFARSESYDKSNQYAPYINGTLFDLHHPKLPLAPYQIESLYRAAKLYDWVNVRPEIFGSIFERAIRHEKRHELGMHFTRETDILKVVMPTVVEPWRKRIYYLRTPKEAASAVEAMKNYHVLDPACGCGNFLYVVYREMKRLEAALKAKWTECHLRTKRKKDCPPPPPGQYFTLRQLHGIEIDQFAAQLARVVLWIGEYLAAREHALEDATLPLQDLSDVVRHADALLTDWVRPAGELAIVGNPPYLGVRKMRAELGDSYVEELFARYPENCAADYVTYWFPQALATLHSGERAGFVTTNSIAQNESRAASIDKILQHGGTLVNAWKSYPWPGEAAVHVSIVNWIMAADEGIKMLDGAEVSNISPRLSDAIDVSNAKKLTANTGLSFMGVTPGNNGFVLSDEECAKIIAADPKSADVIKPFLIGRDVNREVDQQPTRWIIDFDMLEKSDAEQYVGAFRYVQREVYPRRSLNPREKDMKRWWGFWRPASEMLKALKPLRDAWLFHVLQSILSISFVQRHIASIIAYTFSLYLSGIISVLCNRLYMKSGDYHAARRWKIALPIPDRLFLKPFPSPCCPMAPTILA